MSCNDDNFALNVNILGIVLPSKYLQVDLQSCLNQDLIYLHEIDEHCLIGVTLTCHYVRT